MTSKNNYNEIYVWIWLPDATKPIVAGKMNRVDDRILFTYGKSYLENPKAISIYDKELPLINGSHERPVHKTPLHGCIRDASPDSWGRKVIIYKLLNLKGKEADTNILDEFTYLMESGSDRIGALDFQISAKEYKERLAKQAGLEDLQRFTEAVEKGEELHEELFNAIQHGTPIGVGGARPKVFIDDNDKKYIAKFSLSTDADNVIKAEFIGMRMAKLCGLNVANVELTKTSGKDVLLIERFDRIQQGDGWHRKLMLSALTLLGLDEMTGRYASYGDLTELIRHRFTDTTITLHELFSRLVFNIFCGNTDDHARNHAAFWDGENLTLTPAYDICPQLRRTGDATQAMNIIDEDNSSRFTTCLRAAHNFKLSEEQAREIIDKQRAIIEAKQSELFDEAELSPTERKIFENFLFCNDSIFIGY